MSNLPQLAREKALYRYSHALAQGDFAVVAEVLAQAEGDALLEQMILELNEAEMMAENPAVSFEFERGEERKRPSAPPRSPFNWHNLRQNFTRRRILTGGGIVVGIFVFFIVFGNLLLLQDSGMGYNESFGQPGSALAGEPMPQPTVVALYGLDAPLASRANSPLDFLNLLSSDSSTQDVPPPSQEGDVTTETSGENANVEQQEPVTRLIIRNGTVQVSVEDTLTVKQGIEDRVADMAGDGAFIISSNESGNRNGSPTINISIRVPASEFDATMDWLAEQAAEGTTATRSETADDVTAEYVDIAARVESLQAARDRLLELMQNAETTEELLLAEQQLTQREAEIDGLQGRLQYLSQSAQLSRIDITLQPYILNQPVETGWRPAETVRRAYESLLESGEGFVDFVIVFLIAVLPWLVAVGLFLYLFIRFIWRPFRARQR